MGETWRYRLSPITQRLKGVLLMRKIIVLSFITLDGVMQAPGGPEEDPTSGFRYGGWTVPYFDDFLGQTMAEQMSRPFDLLLGRKTYEILQRTGRTTTTKGPE